MPAVLLDTDIGDDIDDAWALALCLTHPQVRLLGVTTVYGDTVARAVLARWLIEATGKTVPVVAGEGAPIGRSAPTDRPNQMAALSAEDEQRLRPDRTDGVAFLAETARAYRGEDLVLLTVGPLTNAAKLLVEHPDAARKIARIVAMVGTLLPDHPQPEYNAKVDATATRILFESGKPLTMVGLDVTLRCRLSQSDLDAFANSDKVLVQRLMALTRAWQTAHRRPDGTVPMPILHDPLAALVVAEPDAVTLQPMRIVVDGEGRTRKADGPPNCQVAVDVQPDRVVARLKRLLLDGQGA
ncbi:Pyrimidine-specific ribonucleoside hydrolase RihA [bacterium HR17]|uniref:Pyrimidine-specific ribonucleoside hydrolase RihA n=1 Tax=Candidatus Fervidibacter japonicus TaxID=2035412 RepID=A0A2H5X9K8_9BACT|nr:Pyrimidine-specific ribonucleoside hydrolase RihA [bacterium HR17]